MKKSFLKNKRILITGSQGFIGSHFFDFFKDNGVYVVGTILKKNKQKLKNNKNCKIAVLDILNKKSLAAICKKEKINLIIHCAALDGNSEFKKNNSVRIMDENLRMVSNILNVAKDQKIKELVIMSSAEIYAPNMKNPIKEEDDYRKYLPKLDDGYVVAKIFSETMANQYSSQFGLKIMLPRPTNVYGPDDNTKSGSSRVIPSLIKNILAGSKVEIWGDGNQVRSFIYIEDFIESVIGLLEKKEFSAINISSSESISIKDLAELIAEISKRKIKISFNKSKPVGTRKMILDISKLNSLIDFKPVPLRKGLKIIIDELIVP